MRSMTDSHARELHGAIIAAATIVFVKRGFAATSMEDIAAKAETTRRTLYKHFPTKEDIFSAMVEAGAQQFLGGLGQPADYAREPVKAITIYSARFLELSACSYTIAFQRMVLAAGLADASNRIYQAAYAPAYERLAVYLRAQFQLKEERKNDWFAFAQHMLEAATGAERTAILFGTKPPLPSPPLSIPGASCDLAAIERIISRQLAPLTKQ
jgi:AcrR family transcriptional regulator